MAAPKGFLVVPVGFNPDGDLRSLELDANDNLKVVLDAAAEGLVGTHGWIGAAWQKDPLRFGFSARLNENLSDTSIGAGTADLTGSAVPADEIWIVQQIAIRHDGTAPTSTQSFIGLNNDVVNLQHIPNPTSGIWYPYSCEVIMEEGDIMTMRSFGSTAGDDMYCKWFGYRVDLDQ